MAIAQEASIATSDADRREDFCESCNILGVPIATTSLDRAIGTVDSWLDSWLEKASRARLVTFSTVHMLTEAHKNLGLFRALQGTDLNCPDGMPLVWMGKLKGYDTERVAGPDFMPAFCAATAAKGYRHFFYGGQAGVAERAISNLKKVSPELQVAGWYCPPIIDLGSQEDAEGVRAINESGADIVWICLGCPKQEMWMWKHRDCLKVGVLLPVGLAFDIVAGARKRAPAMLRSYGLEWLYRLLVEPRRLMGRYVSSNLTFIYLLARSAFADKRMRSGSACLPQEIVER
jgi:N-acetylglucosaminyldiphosphoundecaprenol N-acetyl-beta-D-mannosaminyltransferase